MKILFISDTHGLHSVVPNLPDADIFVHCGDFMNTGRKGHELQSFNDWLGTLSIPKEKRLIVAGNHDIWFDPSHAESSSSRASIAKAGLTNGRYFENESVEVDGLKFYFSPITPWFLNWAFNVDRGKAIKKYWDMIPNDTDILVTHGPPYGTLDTSAAGGPHLGCEDLRNAIGRVLPSIHAFGHIHGGRGTKSFGILMKPCTYINAAFLNEQYRPHFGAGYTLVEITPTPHVAGKYRVEVLEQ